ncbi:hypothetical protein SteCoe_8686 [Stentor coeruleus]|uniref:4Fe-4S ferredoxin-type domain-containing protein n=1 Tax=Stentor coeruleus TaxID=5963 RepID=A0A1R2CJK5_9CILI|nr:hypothetical protein SteCoe_8686 [Stentor coeruleus]
MGKVLLAFPLLYITLATCCLNCLISSTTCLTCSTYYYLYNSKICLSSCPTGYTLNSVNCEDSASKTLFNLDFSLYSNISLTSIENFYTYEQERMSSPSSKTLSPTLDRGLYSNPKSAMYSSIKWIPGPDMTYEMWIYMMESGIVFQVLDSSTTNINIYISSSYLNYYVRLRSQLFESDDGIYTYSTGIPLQWNYIKIITNQVTSASVNVKIYVNNKLSQSTYNNYEFKLTYSSTWVIGSESLSSSSFEGFLYSFRIDTDVILSDLISISPPSCNISYYYTGSNCASCLSSCPNVPNCISSSTCSICASCEYCLGYNSSDCYCDGTLCCQSSCISCADSIYKCDICDDGYKITNGICKMDIVPDKIYQVFDGDFSGYYGSFRTGEDGLKYYFVNDPESLDPIPAYQRGLYFNSGRYLLYEADLILESSFAIGLWIKPTSGGVFYKGPELSYDLNAFKIQYLDISTLTSTLYNYTCNTASFTKWSYISLTVEAIGTDLLITSYLNNMQQSSNNFISSSFQDSSASSLILGKSSTANYTGFIYSISIWKQSIKNFAFEYYDEPCGPSLTSSCLNECSISSYFDRICYSCENSCGIGCVDSRESCTICKYYLCYGCSSFDATTCFKCSDNASGDPCKCNEKFFDSSDYNVCMPCYERCQKCSNDGFKCDTCNSTYLYTNGICLEKCPNGYSLSSSTCSKTSSLAFSIDLQTTLNLGKIDDFEIGADKKNDYPNFDDNDPWPAVSRGFYFHSKAYILKKDFIFSPFLTFNIWVMVVESGVILSKAGVFEFKSQSSSSGKIILTCMDGKTSETTISFSSSQWNYLSIDIEIYYGDDYSSLKYYKNNYLDKSETYSGFISDNSSNPVYIGSSLSSSSFIGFIAIIKIYSINGYYSNDYSLICSTCLKNTIITKDPYDNSYCSSECTKGCYRSSCFLCTDELCELCKDRATSTCTKCVINSSNSPCECDKGYYQEVSSCKLCYERCSECTSSGYFCKNCVSRWFFQDGLCLIQCSSGYTSSSSSSSCILSSEKVLDLDLKDYITLSSIGDIQIGSDNSNNYPEFEMYDPWPVKDRGYYFHSTASIQYSLILAPYFTISFWAMPIGDGNILIKNSDNLQVTINIANGKINFYLTKEANTLTVSTSYTTEKWNYYTVVLDSQQSYITAETYIGSIQKNQGSINTFIDDLKSTINIGYTSSSNSFEGFLWILRIYNAYKTDFSLLSPTNSCLLSQYPPNCLTCPSSCVKGCDNNYCNQCTDKLCFRCDKYSIPCIECSTYSSLINNICQCNDHYYNNTNICTLCYNFCNKCSGGYMDNCNSCYDNLDFIDNKICGICGIGYTLENGVCSLKSDSFFVLNFNNSVAGTIEDTASGVEILSGTSGEFYANSGPTDPVSSFLRGFYFNGTSSYLVISDKFILPYMFQLTLWVNLQSPSGVIIEKEGFSMYFLDGYLYIKFNLTQSVLLYQASSPIPFGTWHRIHFSLSLLGNTSTLAYYDKSLSEGYFIDYSPGATIGKGQLGYFHGFIYSLIIGIIQETRRISECLDTCEECLDNGYCIPSCPIDAYWIGPHYNNCTECSILCESGCRNEGTCSLCYDEKCIDCDSLDNQSNCFSCAYGTEYNDLCECLEGYIWDPFRLRCFVCRSDQFIENYECIDCPGLCMICKSLDICVECIENSHLVNNMCKCSPGYIGEESCDRHVLGIAFTVINDNDLLFDLSEALWKDLTSADIDVECNLIESWYLEKWSDRQYRIKITYANYPGKNDLVIVTFTNTAKVLSLTNATPNNYTYSIELNEVNQTDKILINEAKNQGQVMTTIITSTIIGASLFSNNPACLWSFINSIQMILFIILASVSIPPRSKGLMISLKNYNLFPNIFYYFTPQGKSHDITRAYELGYDSDSIIINIGSILTAFLFFIFLWFILILFRHLIQIRFYTKTRYIDYINKLIKDYKYGFFIRFWITNYLEFQIAALIGIVNLEYSTVYCIVNIIISALIIFSVLFSPILCAIAINKRTKRLETEQEEYDSKYGTLFYEFNIQKSAAISNFYAICLLRRAVYGFVLLFLKDYGIIQMTLILISTISFLLYLLLLRPFNEKFLNLFNIITEIGALIIFGLIFWLQFDSSDISHYNIDFAIYYTIYFIMSTEIFSSLVLTIKSLKEKADEWRNKNASTKVAPVLSIENEEKENDYFRKRFSRVEMLNRENSKTVSTKKFGSFFEE